MGAESRVVLFAPDSGIAERAATAAFARIAELDRVLSDYRDDSELMRLSALAGGPPLKVSDDLYAVVRRALAIAAETDGAFDITVGPYVVLWRKARRAGRAPDPLALRGAAARVGWRKLVLDTVARSVRLAVPGMRLDAGGIAKGYAADQALAAMRALGIDRAMLAIGGEIVAAQGPPGERGWRVAVEHADSAHREVFLENAAISSSGDTEQFVEIDGRRYSHVVNPRTGLGLTERVAATVVAPDGMSADAYATAMTVLDPDRRAVFMAAHPEARFYLRWMR